MRDPSTFRPTRRQAIAAIGASALLSLHKSSPARQDQRRELARGTVFEALSGAQQRNWNDPGIANIMVSNGRDVVLTDENGAWALPVESGDCIFVIKPPHWSSVRNGTAKDFYLHQPEGTPQVRSTGDFPSAIDFALTRTLEPERFEVLLVADSQAATEEELGYFRADLQSIMATTNAAFAVHHGDVMGDDLSLLPGHLAITRETGIPWHHCPGNHDMNLDSPDQHHAFEAWKQYMGPTQSAFQYAGATFILLNNVEYFGRGSGAKGGRGYQGRIGERQLAFVKNVLRNVPADQLIVVSMHIPLVSFENPESISDTTIDSRALMALLSGRPHCVSFAGHSHTTEHHYLGPDDGFTGQTPHHHHVLTAACGNWWSGPRDHRGVPTADSRDGSPKGVHVLTVDGNSYSTRFVASPGTGCSHMRAMLTAPANRQSEKPASDSETTSSKQRLLVDIFDGGPRTRVSCELVGQPIERFELQRTPTEDPYIVESYAQYKALCKPWVTPARSSHIWCAPLPDDIAPGTYQAIIHAVGEYGQQFTGQHEVVVTV